MKWKKKSHGQRWSSQFTFHMPFLLHFWRTYENVALCMCLFQRRPSSCMHHVYSWTPYPFLILLAPLAEKPLIPSPAYILGFIFKTCDFPEDDTRHIRLPLLRITIQRRRKRELRGRERKTLRSGTESKQAVIVFTTRVVLCHHCQERIHLEQRHGPEKIHIPEIQFYLGYAHAHFTFFTLGISSEKKIRHDVGKILWWEVSKNLSLCFGDFFRHWSNPVCDSASHNNQVYKRLDHGTTVPKPHLDIQSENRVVLLRVRR